MSQRIWSGSLALLAATRGTLFRACLVGLMLASVFGSRSAAQFPNCDCGTLSNLCGGGNEESCWNYDWYCYPQSYCQCMDAFNDSGWCSQFPGPTFCSGVTECYVTRLEISGGGYTEVGGNLVGFTAIGYDDFNVPQPGNGTWSWWTSPELGWFEGGGASVSFHPTHAGTATVYAQFVEGTGTCDPVIQTSAIQVGCPTLSLTLVGPPEVPAGETRSYAIGGYPGSLPPSTVCSLSNPAAGSVGFDGSACVFTAAGGGQSTAISATVYPDNGCSSYTTLPLYVSVPTPPVNVGVEVIYAGQVLAEGGYAYIENSPAMPAVTARLTPPGLGGSAQWSLVVDYQRQNRQDSTAFGPWNVEAGATINLFSGGSIVGGRATLSVSYPPIGQRTFVFHIRGRNPSAGQVRGFLDQGWVPWFAFALARDESGSGCNNDIRQFNAGGPPGPTWDNYWDCPNRSDDYGWGIMQLTNIGRPILATELWDWQANVAAGLCFLTGEKKSIAEASWQTSLDGYTQHLIEHPNHPVPSSDTYVCVTYAFAPSGNERSFLDAIWLKAYNGASGGHYLRWDITAQDWDKNPLNSPPPPYSSFNYVQRTSARYCECGQ
jgi:hypothetical protein